MKENEWKVLLSKALYFSVVVVAELVLFQGGDGFDGYPWMPVWLGGTNSGEWRNIPFRNAMSAEALLKFEYVVYLQTFYHFLSGITSVMPGNRTKKEMILHHVVTMFLMICAFKADRAPEGVVTLFMHDVPDVFTSLTKGLYALELKNATFIAYCGIMVTWCYFRLFLIGKFAISMVYHPGSDLMVLCSYLCVILWSLHCWWFTLFYKMGAKFIESKGKALPKDTSQHDIACCGSDLVGVSGISGDDKIKDSMGSRNSSAGDVGLDIDSPRSTATRARSKKE